MLHYFVINVINLRVNIRIIYSVKSKNEVIKNKCFEVIFVGFSDNID